MNLNKLTYNKFLLYVRSLLSVIKKKFLFVGYLLIVVVVVVVVSIL